MNPTKICRICPLITNQCQIVEMEKLLRLGSRFHVSRKTVVPNHMVVTLRFVTMMMDYIH